MGTQCGANTRAPACESPLCRPADAAADGVHDEPSSVRRSIHKRERERASERKTHTHTRTHKTRITSANTNLCCKGVASENALCRPAADDLCLCQANTEGHQATPAVEHTHKHRREAVQVLWRKAPPKRKHNLEIGLGHQHQQLGVPFCWLRQQNADARICVRK